MKCRTWHCWLRTRADEHAIRNIRSEWRFSRGMSLSLQAGATQVPHWEMWIGPFQGTRRSNGVGWFGYSLYSAKKWGQENWYPLLALYSWIRSSTTGKRKAWHHFLAILQATVDSHHAELESNWQDKDGAPLQIVNRTNNALESYNCRFNKIFSKQPTLIEFTMLTKE